LLFYFYFSASCVSIAEIQPASKLWSAGRSNRTASPNDRVTHRNH
jgi:hypothetical protein